MTVMTVRPSPKLATSRWSGVCLPLILLALLAGCDGDDAGLGPVLPPVTSPVPTPTPTPTPAPPPAPVTVTTDFSVGFDGWLAEIADYPQGREKSLEFDTGAEPLPAPFDRRRGVRLSSVNRPDDIFMYLSRPVTGLAPGTRYSIGSVVTFLTNKPADCAGVGGAPGTSVYVKAGASPALPGLVLRDLGVRVSFDKGNQGNSGTDVRLIGDFSQPQPGGSCGGDTFQEKTLRGDSGTAPVVTSDAQGRLWLVVGTDSGFEGLTDIYWLSATFTLTPQ